jgi:predicted Fe-S protein YdhL (DUF1289 family)
VSAEDFVTLGYSSTHNIIFNGEEKTEITVAEWNEMSTDERDEVIQETLNSLVDVYVKNEDAEQ